MTEPLPRRPRPARPPGDVWLPLLGELTADRELKYSLGAAGARGHAWLRAWAAVPEGCLVVLSWMEGLDLTEVARPLRRALHEQFGSPFALAELSPGGLDLVLPPEPGEDQAWLRLWPAEEGTGFGEKAAAWWAVYGDAVVST